MHTARPALLAALVVALAACDDDGGSGAPPPPPVNHPPVALAGPDRATGTGWITTLDSRASYDPDGDALVHTWFQRSGPPVELVANPDGTYHFLAPAEPVTLEFGLVVSDGAATGSDEVEVRVADPGNWPPRAHAGADRVVARRSAVLLTGSGEDPEGDALTWLWEQLSGPPVALLDADQPIATFVAPTADADLEFRLTVGDGLTNDWDTVVVQVRNHRPVLGGVALSPAAPLTADDLLASASALDPDQDPLTLSYAWRRNGALLDGRTGAVLPASETTKGDVVTVAITASDGELSATAEASATIGDSPPDLAAEVPATVTHGVPVAFPVTASDPDGDDVGDLVLAHGPAGMTVTSGTVSWTPTLPMFDRALDVHFAVAPATAPAARLEGTLRVVDPGRAYPLRRTGIEIPAPRNGVVAADLDGNGTAELLVGGARGLFELAAVDGGYAQAWAHPFAPTVSEGVTAVAAHDVDGDGRKEIFFSSGAALVALDGVERRELRRITTAPSSYYPYEDVACADLELADLDGDGGPELVCLHPGGTSAYETTAALLVLDAASFATEWSWPSPWLGRDLAVGDVDGDGRLEIVTSAGYVFDGATGANEWLYSPGFGAAVDTGDLDGDGAEEIVAAKDGGVVGYGALVKSPLFQWKSSDSSSYSEVLLVGDLDGDGALEIGTGSRSWGPVVALRYRPETNAAEVAFQVANPDGGVSALAAADLDGDGGVELVWGAGGYSSGEDVLVVAGPNGSGARVTEWASRNPSQLDGPFVGARLAALGGGARRLLFATPSTDSGYAGTRVLALDPSTGALAVSPELGTNWNESASLDAGDVDGDGVDEAFLTTAALYDGYFTVYDPALAATEWTSQLDIGDGRAVVAADLNGDGAPDLLAITSDGVLHAYDPKNRTLLWQSVAIGGAGVDVEVADVDADGAREIVALTATRLVVYGHPPGSIPWLEEASATVAGALDLAVADGDGDGTPELHVLAGTGTWPVSGSTILRFDGAALPLGSITLPAAALSLHVEDLGFARQNLVVATGPSYYWDDIPAVLRAVDARTGAEIWSSPALLGAPSRNSVSWVDADGDGDREIACGTSTSMYVTR